MYMREDNMEIRPLKIHFCKEEREEILNGIEEILDYGKLSQGENVRLFEESESFMIKS